MKDDGWPVQPPRRAERGLRAAVPRWKEEEQTEDAPAVLATHRAVTVQRSGKAVQSRKPASAVERSAAEALRVWSGARADKRA